MGEVLYGSYICISKRSRFFDKVAKCLYVHDLRTRNISSDAYLQQFPLSAFAFSHHWYSPKSISLSCSRHDNNEVGLTSDGGVLLANLIAASKVNTVTLEHFRPNSVGCLVRIIDACRNSAVKCVQLNHVEVDGDTYYSLLRHCPSSPSHLKTVEMDIYPVSTPESMQQAMHLISALKYNNSVKYLFLRNNDGDEVPSVARVERHLATCLCDIKSFKALVYKSNHTLTYLNALNAKTREVNRNGDVESQLHELLSLNFFPMGTQSHIFFSRN
jgi:hypothetical protein